MARGRRIFTATAAGTDSRAGWVADLEALRAEMDAESDPHAGARMRLAEIEALEQEARRACAERARALREQLSPQAARLDEQIHKTNLAMRHFPHDDPRRAELQGEVRRLRELYEQRIEEPLRQPLVERERAIDALGEERRALEEQVASSADAGDRAMVARMIRAGEIMERGLRELGWEDTPPGLRDSLEGFTHEIAEIDARLDAMSRERMYEEDPERRKQLWHAICTERAERLALQMLLDGARETEAERRRQVVMRALRMTRAVGVPGSPAPDFASRSRKSEARMIGGVLDILPREWGERMMADAPNVRVSVSKRAYVKSNSIGERVIALSGEGRRREDVAVHEVAHWAEHTNPRVVASERAYFRHRTGQLDGRRGIALPMGRGFGRDERYVEGDPPWQERYLGRDYGGQSFELLSCGLESLLSRSAETDDYLGDDEYRRWLLGTIATC